MNRKRGLKGVVAGGLLASLLALSGCEDSKQLAQQTAEVPEILLYCGITMVKPMKEIASAIEKQEGVRVTITQGGSEDLYQSLNASRKGDLYLPGSASYRKRHLDEGLLGDSVHIGYNQASMMVARGNPRGISADVKELLREDLKTVICDPDTGSIGRETKKILSQAGIFEGVMDRALYLTTDSRNLNNAIKSGEAEVTINWRATGFFPENRDKIDIVDLDPAQAIPKKLVLNQLTFSKYPEIGKRFMEYSASEAGQRIFRKHGFLDKDMQTDKSLAEATSTGS